MLLQFFCSQASQPLWSVNFLTVWLFPSLEMIYLTAHLP